MSKSVKTALVGNGIIFICKGIGAFLTGSPSMIAETWHSGADVGNQGLLLFGDKRSKRPACELHQFGHGKELYFWSFIVALLLFTLGSVYSVYEGVHKLLHPEPLENLFFNMAILVVAFVVESYSWYVAWQELGSPGVKEMIGEIVESKDADDVVVFVEDTGALVGLGLAFCGNLIAYFTDNPMWDAMASVSIGVLLGIMAYFLANEMRKLMIGEAIAPVERRWIRRYLNANENVVTVYDLKTMQLGPDSSALMVFVDFKDELHDGELDVIIADISAAIKSRFPSIDHIAIQPTKRKKE